MNKEKEKSGTYQTKIMEPETKKEEPKAQAAAPAVKSVCPVCKSANVVRQEFPDGGTIVLRCMQTSCGYVAHYVNGKLV